MPIIAVSHLEVAYTGKEAHASAYPYLGINAADALVVAQTAIGLLRQHLRPGDRVHGIVTKGGDAANIIPAHTDGQWMVRAETLEQLEERPGQGDPLLRGRRPGHRGDPGDDRGPRALLRDAPRPRAVGPVPAQRRGPRAALPRPERPGRRVDRHGQRVPGPALDPPHHRHRRRSRRSTTSPSSPPSAPPRRPTRRWSTARWPWPGPRSTPPPTSPCATGCWPASRAPGGRTGRGRRPGACLWPPRRRRGG